MYQQFFRSFNTDYMLELTGKEFVDVPCRKNQDLFELACDTFRMNDHMKKFHNDRKNYYFIKKVEK